VRKLSNILKCIAAAEAVCALVGAAPAQKKVKDQAEYDIYNHFFKDAADPARQISDMDSWNQKYLDSEYKDDRVYMYMQACLKMNSPQTAKVLEYGRQLMSKDMGAIFGCAGSEQLAGLPIKLTMLNVRTLIEARPACRPKELLDTETAKLDALKTSPCSTLAKSGNNPARSGMSPARSGMSPARSGMSPARSGMSPARSGMSNVTASTKK